MKVIMDYLGVAEGTTIHRNKTEGDITSPYGIYRVAFPDAEIFKYIDKVADKWSDSVDWDESDIEEVNAGLDQDEVLRLATEFYVGFLKGAHIELFPEEVRVTAMSLYVNSPKNMWKAVQEALLNLQKSGRLDSSLTLSVVDGGYGEKTRVGLESARGLGMTLEDNILLAMSNRYISLWKGNQAKFSPYLMGWSNRLDKLNELK